MPDLYGFDVETYPIQPGEPAPTLVCLSWAAPSGATGLLTAAEGVAWFRAALESGASLIAHHARFDVCVMLRADPTLLPLVFEALNAGRIHCTMIREQLLRIAKGKSLKVGLSLADLVVQYRAGRDRRAGKRRADAWRIRYNELEHLPVTDWPVAARDYAIEDAVDALAVAFAQQIQGCSAVEAEGEDWPMFYDETHPHCGSVINEPAQVQAAVAMYLMSMYGVRTDADAVRALREDLEAKRESLRPQLVAAGLLRANGTKDTTALKRRILGRAAASHGLVVSDDLTSHEAVAWLAEQGVRVPTTDKGDVKTGQEILEVIEDDAVAALVEYDALGKSLGTFVPVLERGVERPITASFGALVASGRGSCSNPNLQNLPRSGGERRCFVARRGKVYVAVDYSTLELRAWAQRCINLGIESRMAEVMRTRDARGEYMDVHLMFAASMLGWEYEFAAEAMRGAHGKEQKALIKQMRGVAKPLNFGAPVGMGAPKLKESAKNSYGVDFDALGIDAEATLAHWKACWPEAPRYFNFVSDQLQDTGEVSRYDRVLSDGTVEVVERPKMRGSFRLQRSGRIRGRCGFTDGANYGFQGLAADGAKAALWAATQECFNDPTSPLFGARIWNFVHDELIIEVDEARASAAADRLHDIMVEQMVPFIPDVPVLCEVTVMTRWDKAAESKRQDDGTWSVWRG